MRNPIATAIFFLLIGTSLALAQQSGGKTTGTSQPTAAPRVLEAPVGHRQPRASDLPESADKPYVESPQNKALDRKIKSICRGC